MRRLKTGKTASMGEVTGEKMKGGDNMVVDCTWKMGNIALIAVLCLKSGDLL